ncbi:MAG: hypothetical protein N2450_08100 [bacterium]|nr:hypothetical protein [bacterium]
MRVVTIEYTYAFGGKWDGLPCWVVNLADFENHPNLPSEVLEADEIAAACSSFPETPVIITGGEPLAYGALTSTCKLLLEKGHTVRVETPGSISLARLPEGVFRRVIWRKPKTPWTTSALPSEQVILELIENDELAFFIESKSSFDWALERVRQHRLTKHIHVEMIPDGKVTRKELGRWIFETGLPIRLAYPLE